MGGRGLSGRRDGSVYLAGQRISANGEQGGRVSGVRKLLTQIKWLPVLAVVGILTALALVLVDIDLYRIAIVVVISALVLATLTTKENP